METSIVRRGNLKRLQSIMALVGLLALSLHHLMPHDHQHTDATRTLAADCSHDSCGQQWQCSETPGHRSPQTTGVCQLCNELHRGAGLDFRETPTLIPPSSGARGAWTERRPLTYLVESQPEARGPPDA